MFFYVILFNIIIISKEIDIMEIKKKIYKLKKIPSYRASMNGKMALNEVFDFNSLIPNNFVFIK